MKAITNSIDKRKATSIMAALVLVIIIILTMITISDVVINSKLESEWGYVEISYTQAVEEARKSDEKIVERIQEGVDATYANSPEKLGNDLKNVNYVNDLSTILSNSIRNTFLFGIENDNNDPFIANKTMLLADLSDNCSVGEEISRSFEEEVSMHFSKQLARNALKSISTGENKTVIWSFLEVSESLPWHEEVENMQYADMVTLKELFFKYHGDIRVLQSFEFLTPYYVYRDADLLGTPTVNEIGKKNKDNYQLTVVQGFNIVDIMKYNGTLEHTKNTQFEISQLVDIISLVLAVLVLAVILYLIIVSILHNKEQKK